MFYKKVIPIPIYRGRFIIILTDDKEELRKKTGFGDYTLGSFEEYIFAHHVFSDYNGWQGYHVVLNPNYEYKDISPGVVAHECLHFVLELFKERGIEPDVDNPEPATYLLEWAVEEVHKFMDQKIKPTKK